jgi:hypothetical protein
MHHLNSNSVDRNFSIVDRKLIQAIIERSRPANNFPSAERRILQLAAALFTGQFLELREARCNGQYLLITVFRNGCGVVEDVGVSTWAVDGGFVTLPSTIVRDIFGAEVA